MLQTIGTATAAQVESIAKSAAAILDGADALLTGSNRDVVAYVRELQRASAAFARASVLAEDAGLAAELEQIRRKQSGIDSALARRLTRIANNIGKAREESIGSLNAVFDLGHAPDIVPDGVFRGQLLSSTLWGPLDSFGRSFTRLYLPWKGKRFDSSKATGRNIFTRSAPITGRIYWPFYGDWQQYKPGYFTGFKFDTYVGPSVDNPQVSTFKLDYDNPTNPLFLVRSVLDELVQITDNYYLGKAMLWRPKGHYELAAFFALRKQR